MLSHSTLPGRQVGSALYFWGDTTMKQQMFLLPWDVYLFSNKHQGMYFKVYFSGVCVAEHNRPFPGYLVPLFQNESVQKLSCENEFDLRENEPQVGTLFYYCFRTTWKWPTSFPGPLFLPPPGAPRGGRKRDPGTEVGKWPKLLRLATYHTLLTCPLCILV